MVVGAVAGQVGKRLGHEGGQEAVLLGDGLDHPLEEGVPVGGGGTVPVEPVQLELAGGILVVGGIRPPA